MNTIFKASDYESLSAFLHFTGAKLEDDVTLEIKNEVVKGDRRYLNTSHGEFNERSIMLAFVAVGDPEKAIANASNPKLRCLNQRSTELVPLYEYFKKEVGPEFQLPLTLKCLKRIPKGVNPTHMNKDAETSAIYDKEKIAEEAEKAGMKADAQGRYGDDMFVPLWRKSLRDGNAPSETFVFEAPSKEEIAAIKKAMEAVAAPVTA